MTPIADLRSDTETPPTVPMRNAMAAASLGDDAFGDPQVNLSEIMLHKLSL